MHKISRPRRSLAFTLIKLLVVIAIIGVLVAPAAAGRAGGAQSAQRGPVRPTISSRWGWPP